MNKLVVGALVVGVAGLIFSQALAETVDARVFKHRANIATSGYAGQYALTDFPILVRLSAGSPSGFDPADAGENGCDLRFYTPEGSLLAHEIDEWNPSGESVVWVKIPSLTAETTICMGWGFKAGQSAPIFPAKDVWTSYYAVWHMNEAAGEPMIDRTGNGHDLAITLDGAEAVPYADTFTVGHGRVSTNSFTGAGFVDLGAAFTISGTMKCTTTWSSGQYPRVFRTKAAYNSTDSGVYCSLQGSPTRFSIFTTVENPFTCPNACQNPLYFAVGYSSSYNPHLGSFYSAGVRVYGLNQPMYGGSVADTAEACGGNLANPVVYDEVRVMARETIVKSGDQWVNAWVKADYDTKTNPDFIAWSDASPVIAQVPATMAWYGSPAEARPVFVTDSDGNDLVEDTDYLLSWSGATDGVGTAYMTITGIGAYEGWSQTFTYETVNGYGPVKTLFVSPDADDSEDEDCSSWARAGTLSNACSRATAGTAAAHNLIIAADGVYDCTLVGSKAGMGTAKAVARKTANYVDIRSYSNDPSKCVFVGGGVEGDPFRLLDVSGYTTISGLTVSNFVTTADAGAIYATRDLTLTNCIIACNVSSGNDSAAVRLKQEGWQTISTVCDCLFVGNSNAQESAYNSLATQDGLILLGCTFRENRGCGNGIRGGGSARDCTFVGNETPGTSTTRSLLGIGTVSNCTFIGNISGGYGCNASSATWRDCVFKRNKSTYEGCAVGYGNFYDCSFEDNTNACQRNDWAYGTVNADSKVVSNCTFVGSAGNAYAAVFDRTARGKVYDCKFRFNRVPVLRGYFDAFDCEIVSNGYLRGTSEQVSGCDHLVMSANNRSWTSSSIHRCTIRDNYVTYRVAKSTTAYNCLVANNVGSADRRAFLFDVALYNCTVVSNTSVLTGNYRMNVTGDMAQSDCEYGPIVNCLFLGNRDSSGAKLTDIGADYYKYMPATNNVAETIGNDLAPDNTTNWKLADIGGEAVLRLRADELHPYGYAPRSRRSFLVDRGLFTEADFLAWGCPTNELGVTDLTCVNTRVYGKTDIGCYEWHPKNSGLLLLVK